MSERANLKSISQAALIGSTPRSSELVQAGYRHQTKVMEKEIDDSRNYMVQMLASERQEVGEMVHE